MVTGLKKTIGCKVIEIVLAEEGGKKGKKVVGTEGPRGGFASAGGGRGTGHDDVLL